MQIRFSPWIIFLYWHNSNSTLIPIKVGWDSLNFHSNGFHLDLFEKHYKSYLSDELKVNGSKFLCLNYMMIQYFVPKNLYESLQKNWYQGATIVFMLHLFFQLRMCIVIWSIYCSLRFQLYIFRSTVRSLPLQYIFNSSNTNCQMSKSVHYCLTWKIECVPQSIHTRAIHDSNALTVLHLSEFIFRVFRSCLAYGFLICPLCSAIVERSKFESPNNRFWNNQHEFKFICYLNEQMRDEICILLCYL